MKPTKHIAIIGAGPAGLMAAEVIASAGIGVTIYDKMPSPARKFLMAGRGGLNLTHSEPMDKFMARYGSAEDWLAPYINQFPPSALRSWCEGLGEETFIGSSGRIFPKSMKAAPLLRAWLKRLDSLGVRFAAQHSWHGCDGDALVFQNKSGEIIKTTPDATLLALGGASWARLGSDGGWVNILAEWNIPISQLRPANCGFVVNWSEHFRTRFAGEPLKSVMLTHNGVSRQGEAMITANGIEGGVVYVMSALLRDAIEKDGKATLTIDLRPNMSLDELAKKLEIARGNKSLSNHLRNARFSPIAISLLHETTSKEELAKFSAGELAARLKSLPITIVATAGMNRAISTAGGISLEALTDDLMLKNKPRFFAAGEMLDWEAPTGGYLLQACFSTAFAAGQGVVRLAG